MLIQNLITLYHIIVASENLLIVAAQRSEGTLRAYLEHHLEEERDHAKWLEEDLHSVGVDIRDTSAPKLVMEMVGSVYYLIFHVSPVALLGYMWVLESYPFDEAQLRRLEQEYPASLLRTIKHHVKHDPRHLEDLQKIIEREGNPLVEYVKEMTSVYLKHIELIT